MVGLAGAVAALLMLGAAASPASAASCDRDLIGGGPSVWEPLSAGGKFSEATLFTEVGLDLERDDAFDAPVAPTIEGIPYTNPDEQGCTYPKGRREVLFPSAVVAGISVKPELYVSKGRPLGRTLVSLRNTTAASLTVDFLWDDDLGSDGGTNVSQTSSGDGVADAVDRWSTSCEDDENDGCSNTGGFDAERDPELALNWESKGKKRHSADAVEVAGNYDVAFDDVTIGAGKTVAFFHVATLAPTIRAANKAAKAIDKNPRKAGVFAKLSKRELRQLQNWKKPRLRRGR